MNEIVNDSDSEAENISAFSSSEESECEGAVQSDNEGDISIPGPSRRQTLPQLQGFLIMIVNREYHPSLAIRACNFQLKMK